MAELEGMQLGTCRILRRLRRGGMGDVYLAEQPSLGRQVVVKVIHGAGREDPQAMAAPESREQAARQFAQEARAIAALDHPHILPLYEYGEQDGIHYLVMPYVEHGSLADLLQPVPPDAPGALALPLPAAFVADIIEQTAEALQFAHQRGIIHRDVKPGNLLIRLLSSAPASGVDHPREGASDVGPDGADGGIGVIRAATNTRAHVLLADFGLARFLSGLNPNTGTTGTPLYSAPEHYTGHPVPATDQYALACVTFYLLAGQPVFSGTVAELYHQHMSVDPPPVTRINPLLPPAVDTVVLRALAKDPAQRYPQILDYARALGSALDPMTSVSRPLWPTRSLTAGVASVAAGVVARASDTVMAVGDEHQAPPLPARYASQARDLEFSPDGLLLMRSPVSADGLTEPASGVPAPRQAAVPGEWPSPSEPAASASGPAPARRSAYPDAPGAPLPWRWRRRRPLMLLALGVLLLAALGGLAWRVVPHFIAEAQLAAHAITITRSGTFTLSSVTAAQPAKNSVGAPLLVRTRWSADEAVAVVTAAQHIAGLPTLTPARALPAASAATAETITGPGQTETGEASPGQVSVASDGHTLVIAVDSTMQIRPIPSPGQPSAKPLVIALASLVAPVLRPGDMLGEPRVLFDATSRRWVIVVAELQPGSSPAGAIAAGFFDLAVSDAADALGAWHAYQFTSAVAAVPGCNWADDPQLGDNDTSFVLTGNSFACGAAGAFQGATLWDIPKDTFLHDTPTKVYAFSGFANVQHQPVFTLTPAVQTDAGSGLEGTQWLVSTDAGYADRGQTSSHVIVWAFAQPGQESRSIVPTLTGVVLTLPHPYADPPAVAAGNSTQVRIGDARPTQTQAIGGHLYTAFTTAANWTGNTATGAGIYWLDIVPQPSSAHGSDQQAPNLRVNQAGIFGLAGADVFAPALVASASGDLALVAAESSSPAPAHLVFALRAHGDPTGTFGQHILGPLTASAPLLFDGQGGAALAASPESTSEDHGVTSGVSLWTAGVVTTGPEQPWQAQLWHVENQGGG